MAMAAEKVGEPTIDGASSAAVLADLDLFIHHGTLDVQEYALLLLTANPLAVDDNENAHDEYTSEGHARMYDALYLVHDNDYKHLNVATDKKEQQMLDARMLKGLRGLHRRPRIPCTTTVDGKHSKPFDGLSPFWFSHAPSRGGDAATEETEDKRDAILNALLAQTHALTAFQELYTAPRRPEFLEGDRPLPAFEHILAGGAAAATVAPPPPPMERSESLTQLFHCSLCMEIMKDPASLPCGHSGCIGCLRQSFKNGFRKCPLCARNVELSEEKKLCVNFTLRDAIEKLYPTPSPFTSFPPFASTQLAAVYPDNPLDRPVGSTQRAVEELASVSAAKLDEEALRDVLRASTRAATSPAAGGRRGGKEGKVCSGFTAVHLQSILRRAGVLAEHSDVLGGLREAIRAYLDGALEAASRLARRRSSDVIQVGDVIAARPGGRTMLGYGGDASVRYAWSDRVYRGLDPVAASVFNDIYTDLLHTLVQEATAVRRSLVHYRGKVKFEDREELDDRARGKRCEYIESYDYTDLQSILYTVENCAFIPGTGINCGFDSEVINPDFERLEEPLTVLTSLDVEAAASSTGESSYFEHIDRNSRNFDERLEARLWLVARVAGRPFNLPMSECAVDLLATEMEAATEILFAASRDIARENDSPVIGCHHIALAIRNHALACPYDERGLLLSERIIRNCGELPHVLPSSTFCRAEMEDPAHPPSPLESSLVRKARRSQAASGGTCSFVYYVDPRTGLHRCAAATEKEEDEDDDDKDKGQRISGLATSPAPLLDALSLETAAQRRELARAALSAEDRALMLAEGLGEQEEGAAGATEPGLGGRTGRPMASLAALHRERLGEIRAQQTSTRRLIPLAPLERLCHATGTAQSFSAEALDCIADGLQDYLVRLCAEAGRCAAHAKRCVVLPVDLQFAMRITNRR